MTRLYTSGFEVQSQSTTANYHGESAFDGANNTVAQQVNTPSITTAQARSGSASMLCDTGGDYVRIATGIYGTLDRTYYTRAAFRFADATPATATDLIRIEFATITTITARLETNGTLIARDANGTQIGSASSALSDNTWYVIELETMVPTASTGTVGLRLDGVEVTRSTTVDVNNTVGTPRIHIGHVSGSAVTNVWVDDIAINDNQGSDQNSHCGLGKVVLLKAISDNALGTGWEAPQTSGSDTTAIFSAVDNTPPVGVTHSDVDANNAAYVFNIANVGSASNYDVNCATYTTGGVGSSDTVALTQALVRATTASTTGTNNFGIMSVSNPADGAATTGLNLETGAVGGTEPTGWKTYRTPVQYAPSVTKGSSPVVRASRTETGQTRAHQVDLMGLLVEYLVVTEAPADVDLGQCDAVSTATLAIKAQTTVPLGTSAAQSAATLALTVPTATAVARVSLESGGTPETRTEHSLFVRARKASGAGTVTLRAALYESTNNRSGDLETTALTTSLAEYELAIADLDAEDITSYSDLEVRFWGFSATSDTVDVEVADIWLSTPATTGGAADVALAQCNAVSTATLALSSQTTIALESVVAGASATLSLTAPAIVPLGAAAGLSTSLLALASPTSVPLGSAVASSSATLSLVTPVPLGACAAGSSATLALQAATQVPLGSAAALSTATLSVTALTRVPLDSATAASTATCAVTIPSAATQVPLGTVVAQSAATLALSAATRVALDATAAQSAATLAVTAQTRVALGSAAAQSAATLALARYVPLGQAAALSTATLALSVSTRIALGAVAAQSATTVALTTKTQIVLGQVDAVGSTAIVFGETNPAYLTTTGIIGAERLGVATHPGYADTTYTAVATVFTRLNALGLKLVRGVDPEDLTIADDWCSRAATAGIKVIAGTKIQHIPGDTFFDNLETLIADYPGVIVGVEGYNEPDLFFSYATDEEVGEDWGEYALRHQQTLWNGIQAREIAVDVYSPSVSSHPATNWDIAYANSVEGYCDIATVHYYSGRNDPTLAGMQAYFDKICTYAGTTRTVVTETGYASPNSFYELGQTEAEAASRMEAILDLYFGTSLDVNPERVCIYQFVDLYWNDYEYWGIYYYNWATKQVTGVVDDYPTPDLAGGVLQADGTSSATLTLTLPGTTTAVARVSLEPGNPPAERTSHRLMVRARKVSGAGSVTLRAALYEGAANRSGDLETTALTTSLANYQLAIAEADAEDITDYSNLEIRFWGSSATADTVALEVAEVWLETPVGTPVVDLGQADATSSATLALRSATQVPLGSAAATSTATLALRAPTRVVLGSAAAISTATAQVSTPTVAVLGLGSVAAQSSASLALFAGTIFETHPDLGARDYEVTTGGVFDETVTGGVVVGAIRSGAPVATTTGGVYSEATRSGAVEISLGGYYSETERSAAVDETVTGGYYDEDMTGASEDRVTGAWPDETLTGADADHWTGGEPDEDERSGEPDEVLTGGEIY